jgi:uncharacterized protein YegL
VKKEKLARFLFLSFLAHVGFLLGIDASLRSPPQIVPIGLVPIEAVILDEEPEAAESRPTFSEQEPRIRSLETKSQPSVRTPTIVKNPSKIPPISRKDSLTPRLSIDPDASVDLREPDRAAIEKTLETKSRKLAHTERRKSVEDLAGPAPKGARLRPQIALTPVPSLETLSSDRESPRPTLEAKSRTSAGTETRLEVRDLAGPIPRKGTFEPSLSLSSAPTLGQIPSGREGAAVVTQPIVAKLQMDDLNLPPARPTLLDPSPLLEVDMPRVLVEAETGGSGSFSQTQTKVDVPIGRNRMILGSVSELPPIPTVKSPSIPEEREMVLSQSKRPTTAGLAESKTSKGSDVVLGRDYGKTQSKGSTDSPKLLAPDGDLATLDLDSSAIESASFPERRDVAATPSTPPSEGRSERVATREPRVDSRGETAGVPEIVAPGGRPLTLGLPKGIPFPFPGAPKEAAFLFLLDTSGSVKGEPLDGIKKSAWEFVKLMGPKERAAIMTFNDSPQLVRPFTSERGLLGQDIQKVRTRGRRTVLFDALIKAADIIAKENRESKFIILFSDGKDEGSRASIQDVINGIRSSRVSILCVGYSRVEKKYLDILSRIATETGGVSADAPMFHQIVMLYKAAREATTGASEARTDLEVLQ